MKKTESFEGWFTLIFQVGGLPCPSCDYMASEPWVLNQHMRTVHK